MKRRARGRIRTNFGLEVDFLVYPNVTQGELTRWVPDEQNGRASDTTHVKKKLGVSTRQVRVSWQGGCAKASRVDNLGPQRQGDLEKWAPTRGVIAKMR